MKMRIAGLAAALLAMSLAGCSQAPPPPSSGLLLPSEMPAVWAKDTAAFPEALAPGIEWPTKVPDYFLEENVVNEVGLSAMTAAEYWMCSWEAAYLSAQADGRVEEQAAALDRVAAFHDLDIVLEKFPDRDVWYEAVIVPARAGDEQVIATDFESWCGFYLESNPKDQQQ